MTLFNLVRKLLIERRELRDSDKKLIWEVWRCQGLVDLNDRIGFKDLFFVATTPESITRARRKVAELNPHLKGSPSVEHNRRAKRRSKGTFIFRESVELSFDDKTNTVRKIYK